VPAGWQNAVNVLNFLLSSLTCSQIWLIPLWMISSVDTLQNLKKKKKKPGQIVDTIQGERLAFHIMKRFPKFFAFDKRHQLHLLTTK
jgi:hypothetical protein